LTNNISEKIENADYSGSFEINEKMFTIDLKKI